MIRDNYSQDFTPEERARWEEMKNEPIKATVLTKEEVEQLKKEGRI